MRIRRSRRQSWHRVIGYSSASGQSNCVPNSKNFRVSKNFGLDLDRSLRTRYLDPTTHLGHPVLSPENWPEGFGNCQSFPLGPAIQTLWRPRVLLRSTLLQALAAFDVACFAGTLFQMQLNIATGFCGSCHFGPASLDFQDRGSQKGKSRRPCSERMG